MKVQLLDLMKPPGSASVASSTVGGMPSGSTMRVLEQITRGIKQIYKVIELPFPEDSSYFDKWARIFMPSLLAWAGTHEDPFRLSGELYLVVPQIWKRVFPRISLNITESLTLVKVVSHMM